MDDLLNFTAEIVAAHVANNDIDANDVPALIKTTYGALKRLGEPAVIEAPKQEPAVSVRTSVKPDYIVCLEDGKKLKMLKRYIASRYNMTPAEYRAKWGLPADYPMVAPGYSATRKELALKSGLGRKPAAAPVVTAPVLAKPRGRKAAPKTDSAAKPPVAPGPEAKAVRKPRKTLGIKAALDAGRDFFKTKEPTA